MSESALTDQPIRGRAPSADVRALPEGTSLVEPWQRVGEKTRDAETRSDMSRALAVAAELPDAGVVAAGGARRPQVDVEFAHRCAEPSDRELTRTEIAKSEACARALIAQLSEHEIDAATSILVDDKKNVTSAIDERRWATVRDSVDRLRADRVMLESELVRHLPAFSASLPERSSLPGRFERRLRQHGELACSQDVSIWHSLRLGLFEPAGGHAAWAWDGVACPPVEVCVVVLPTRFQAYEEKAYTENFRHLEGWELDRGAERTILRGRCRGRGVTIRAVWVDVRRPESELLTLGQVQAVELAEQLTSDRVPATTG